MGVSFNGPAPLSPMERLYDIAFRSETAISVPAEPMPLVPVQGDERADIDISGDACVFRSHPATYSDHIRPPVPTHSATCDALP